MMHALAVRQWLHRLDRFLLPRLCALCRQPVIPGESGICVPCRDDLPTNSPCCPRCAGPLAADAGSVPCADCQLAPPPFDRALAPLRFEFPVDAAIRALKFRRRLEFVPAMAGAMREALAESNERPDLVVPVPLHYIRHGRRGFNQAERLAKPVADGAGIPMFLAVARTRATKTQSGLDAASRRRNIKGAFRIIGLPPTQHTLIVDDVMTTGATVAELARALKQQGVDRVTVLVAARRGLG